MKTGMDASLYDLAHRKRRRPNESDPAQAGLLEEAEPAPMTPADDGMYGTVAPGSETSELAREQAQPGAGSAAWRVLERVAICNHADFRPTRLDLAGALHMKENTVNARVADLRRDGLVVEHGMRVVDGAVRATLAITNKGTQALIDRHDAAERRARGGLG